jgi:hypothetical protein
MFILGLVNLLVAGLCLFAGVAKLGQFFLLQAMGPGQRETVYFGGPQERNIPIPDLEAYLDLEVPGYTGWQAGNVFGILVAGIALFAIGYGFLHMRPWVRVLAVLYALAVGAWQVGHLAFQLGHVLPVAEIYFLDESWRSYSFFATAGTGLARRSFLLFAWAEPAVLIGHAAVVLLVLALPSVRAAFRGQSGISEPAPPILSGPPPQPAPSNI